MPHVFKIIWMVKEKQTGQNMAIAVFKYKCVYIYIYKEDFVPTKIQKNHSYFY